MDNQQDEILKMYFRELRTEILERLKLVSRIELGKFVIVTTALGLAIGRGIKKDEAVGMAVVFGLLPFFSLLFDWYIVYHLKMMHTMGRYIRDTIEKRLASGGEELWETYVSNSKHQSRWDALGRTVHLLVTTLVMLICAVFFYDSLKISLGEGHLWVSRGEAFYAAVYILLWVVDLSFLGIHEKLTGEYYT